MCLSQKTVDICKLSAPIITKYSKTITPKLYENLYEKHPKTKTLFGGTSEEQYQQFKSAIVLYIQNIDNIKTIDTSNINIKSEYNVMIKMSLLEAIKDVFGDAATDDLIEAWKEAYIFLGDIVILKEKGLYISA